MNLTIFILKGYKIGGKNYSSVNIPQNIKNGNSDA